MENQLTKSLNERAYQLNYQRAEEIATILHDEGFPVLYFKGGQLYTGSLPTIRVHNTDSAMLERLLMDAFALKFSIDFCSARDSVAEGIPFLKPGSHPGWESRLDYSARLKKENRIPGLLLL